MKLKLISYGLGNKLDLTKFKPIKNRNFIKPEGGLWASPIDSSYGWYDWCKDNNFGNLKSNFKFEFNGNVFVIDCLADAKGLPWVNMFGDVYYPNFEKVVKMGYDAIHLTLKGERETRFSTPSLYGWDCECVLVLTKRGLKCL